MKLVRLLGRLASEASRTALIRIEAGEHWTGEQIASLVDDRYKVFGYKLEFVKNGEKLPKFKQADVYDDRAGEDVVRTKEDPDVNQVRYYRVVVFTD